MRAGDDVAQKPAHRNHEPGKNTDRGQNQTGEEQLVGDEQDDAGKDQDLVDAAQDTEAAEQGRLLQRPARTLRLPIPEEISLHHMTYLLKCPG